VSTQPVEFAFDLDQLEQSSQNYYSNLAEQKQKLADIKAGRYSKAEDKERLAKRANHLVEQTRGLLGPQTRDLAAAAVPLSPTIRAIINRGQVQPDELDDATLERVIGETQDFLSLMFLEKALLINHSVGRIVNRLGGGRVSYGTGFMVSPRLVMTNNHVLPTAEDASRSKIEFDYQQDRSGKFLTVHRFILQPDIFFLTDKKLDFSLIAVAQESEAGKPLLHYGFSQLLKTEGKIIIGEPINIIQHPLGQIKQVVFRNNRLTNLLPLVAHYEADTQPGSSGSPVYNDQWEVVALHHSGVPKKNSKGQYLTTKNKVWKSGDDPSLLAWVANEGIRVSKLVDFIEKAPLQQAEQALRKELLNPPPMDEGIGETPPPQDFTRPSTPLAAAPQPGAAITVTSLPSQPGSLTLTIPLTVTISLGNLALSHAAQTDTQPAPAQPTESPEQSLEKVEQDTQYENRAGFDANFLGFPAPLPKLTKKTLREVLEVPGASPDSPNELKYHHFSVMMNKNRRLAYVAAVNYDGGAPRQFARNGGDRWFFDTRFDKELQAGAEIYAANPLDRGHLVRRLDAAWGKTVDEARRANDDTFHFTNCTPQHEIFNQSGKAVKQGLLLWGNLENHIAKNVSNEKARMSIFNGPVFHRNDRVYRDLQLPREFYKIVVTRNHNGQPMAVAFLLSQKEQLESLEEFVVGEYKPFQVRVSDIEKRTGLDFGILKSYDIKAGRGLESLDTSKVSATEINSLEDINL
jgi:endonuclease G, mitochondrial